MQFVHSEGARRPRRVRGAGVRVISADLTLDRLLRDRPGLLDVLVDLHPHLAQLRNRMLRRLTAPRMTVADAARLAGIPTEAVLAALRQAAGEAAPPPTACPEPVTCERPGDAIERPEPGPRPPVLDGRRAVPVDVRPDIRRGEEPFARIMGAVKALGADEVLVLRTPFEPVPLYGVLARRGLAHWTERHEAGDWSVWFYRAEGVAPGDPAGRADAAPPAPPARTSTIDVRHLEPPLPMVTVLERLDTLGPDETLVVLHERRPLFLYPQLEDRGFTHETDDPEPGLVRITIRARAGR